ncbi:lysophospholipid acyltransferase family protein [candidate division KSB1 bacterium]|nr:lysophospholipid acyltransferase family protein [candidate division KSB1 bacterium]
MIPARHTKYADALFKPYVYRLFKKQFYSIRLMGPAPELDANRPLLLLPNHSTWWDGFFIYLLNKKLWQRRTFLLMLEEQLQKNSFFRLLGAYSIHPDSPAKIRQSLKYTLSVLSEPAQASQRIVCIFPQGVLSPWQQRPLGYKAGILWLLNKINVPVQVMQLAIRAEFLDQQRPEVFFMFSAIGNSILLTDLRALEKNHEQLLDSLAQKITANERGTELLAGARSINERFEKWRRLKF